MTDYAYREAALPDRIRQAHLDAVWPRGAAEVELPDEELAELADFDSLPGGLIEPAEGSGLLKLTSDAELRAALELVSKLHPSSLPPSTIIDTIAHEQERATATAAIGLHAVYALRFINLDGAAVNIEPTTLQVGGPLSKLGLAATLAYPHQLTDNDLHRLMLLGYDGPADIASRIKSSGVNLPLPLSMQ